jgi:hypothetical protein
MDKPNSLEVSKVDLMEKKDEPATKPRSSGLRIRTNVRSGTDRIFDSQNNANGFWDEDEDQV